jgi:hypothetical protein
MAEPHPVELRARVVQAYEAGEDSYSVIRACLPVAEHFALGKDGRFAMAPNARVRA